MAEFKHTRLTSKDIPYSFKPKKGGEGDGSSGEIRFDIDKEDRSSFFNREFGNLEDMYASYKKAQEQTERLKDQINKQLMYLLEVLNVRDDDGSIRNLIDILEREGVALEDRMQTILNLQDITLRIQSKEGQITLSKVTAPAVSWSKCWKLLKDTLNMINESNGESRGTQVLLLKYMDQVEENFTSAPTRINFLSGRRMEPPKRFRKKRNIQQESSGVGNTLEYIWNRIKNGVMKVASQIKKNAEKWFNKSRKIDLNIQELETILISLEETKNNGGYMLKEKYENPKLGRSKFDVDVDEKNREIRIGIPKSRHSHYDTNMEDAEMVQNEIVGIKNKLKKLESKVEKLKNTADEALSVLDDDGTAKSLLEVLEENEEELITIGEGVEKLADLTVRINSTKFTRTLSKVPEKSPNFKIVVEKLQKFLISVDSAVSQNGELLIFIDRLIEETKQEAKSKGRRDLGVKKLGESLLYEFRMVQILKDMWSGMVAKIKMFVRRMRGINQRWNQLSDELNMLMREVLSVTAATMKEGRQIRKSVAKKYTIKERGEECQCPECGYPLYVGDTAYETPDGEESGFCCELCVKEYMSDNYMEE